jgi:hypothetical protein
MNLRWIAGSRWLFVVVLFQLAHLLIRELLIERTYSNYRTTTCDKGCYNRGSIGGNSRKAYDGGSASDRSR